MEQIVQTHRKVVGGHKGFVVVGELEPDGDLFAVHFGGQDAVDVAVIGHAVVAFLVVIPLQMPSTGVALAVVVGEGQVLGQVHDNVALVIYDLILFRGLSNEPIVYFRRQLDVEAGGGQARTSRRLYLVAVHIGNHAVIAIAAGVDGDVGGGDGDGADRVRHGGTIEILRLSRHAVGVHGVQGRFVVGVQAVVALAAVGVICSIGAGFGLRVGQLNGVGQLDLFPYLDRNIDLPHKAFVGLAILTLLVVVQDKLIGSIAIGAKAVGAGHIGISIGGINEFFLIQLLPADSQRQRIQAVDKIKVIFSSTISARTDFVNNLCSFVYQIYHLIGDILESLRQFSCFSSIAGFGDFKIGDTGLGSNPVTEILAILIHGVVFILVGTKSNHLDRILPQDFFLQVLSCFVCSFLDIRILTVRVDILASITDLFPFIRVGIPTRSRQDLLHGHYLGIGGASLRLGARRTAAELGNSILSVADQCFTGNLPILHPISRNTITHQDQVLVCAIPGTQDLFRHHQSGHHIGVFGSRNTVDRSSRFVDRNQPVGQVMGLFVKGYDTNFSFNIVLSCQFIAHGIGRRLRFGNVCFLHATGNINHHDYINRRLIAFGGQGQGHLRLVVRVQVGGRLGLGGLPGILRHFAGINRDDFFVSRL